MDLAAEKVRLDAEGIRSISDLERFVAVATQKFEGADPAFHGHAVHSWKLSPKVFRDPKMTRMAEASSLCFFREKGMSRIEKPPGHTEDVLWLILAQHHGLRTRILDWTLSSLVGLYFAVWESEFDGSDGKLWASTMTGLSGLGEGGNATNHAKLIRAAFRSSIAIEGLTTLRGFEVTPRIAAQQGTFSVHGDDVAIQDRPGADEVLYGVHIPAAFKRTLRDQLARLGIQRHCLFPDLDHLAAFLNSRDWIVLSTVPAVETG